MSYWLIPERLYFVSVPILNLYHIFLMILQVMSDRDTMVNVIAQSSDNHMRFIDAREDLLMTRANKWKDDLVQGTNELVYRDLFVC